MISMKKTVLATALFLSMGTAHAASVSTGGVFNMYSQCASGIIGDGPACTNPINVDSTILGFVDQAAGTWGVASSMPFYGLPWVASNGVLITGAGAHTWDTADTTGASGGVMNFTLGANQIAGAIKFAWGTTTNIDVVNVWDINADGSLTAAVVPGMIDGPFPGFNAAFNLTSPNLVSPTIVPVPAAVWLLGSGLLGLVGVARRKKAA